MYYLAPSFQKGYTIEGEPYSKNGKLYIDVINDNTHNKRSVRAYSATEFNKAYPDHKVEDPMANKLSDPYLDSLKIVRGFKFGPITLLKTSDEEWLRRSPECRYCVEYGWYVVSTEHVPDDFPADLKRSLLSWDEFLTKYWIPKQKGNN